MVHICEAPSGAQGTNRTQYVLNKSHFPCLAFFWVILILSVLILIPSSAIVIAIGRDRTQTFAPMGGWWMDREKHGPATAVTKHPQLIALMLLCGEWTIHHF